MGGLGCLTVGCLMVRQVSSLWLLDVKLPDVVSVRARAAAGRGCSGRGPRYNGGPQVTRAAGPALLHTCCNGVVMAQFRCPVFGGVQGLWRRAQVSGLAPGHCLLSPHTMHR